MKHAMHLRLPNALPPATEPTMLKVQRGALVLIVGPSGAGKDTVMSGARHALAGEDVFSFPPRVITRPVDTGPEHHIAVSPGAFLAAKGNGAFCLAWEAHGHHYGVPESALDLLRGGRVVVVNVSRTVVASAAQISNRVCVVQISASAATLAQRIAKRGREVGESVEARLVRRVTDFSPDGLPFYDICNDGAVELAVDRLAAILREIAFKLRTDSAR